MCVPGFGENTHHQCTLWLSQTRRYALLCHHGSGIGKQRKPNSGLLYEWRKSYCVSVTHSMHIEGYIEIRKMNSFGPNTSLSSHKGHSCFIYLFHSITTVEFNHNVCVFLHVCDKVSLKYVDKDRHASWRHSGQDSTSERVDVCHVWSLSRRMLWLELKPKLSTPRVHSVQENVSLVQHEVDSRARGESRWKQRAGTYEGVCTCEHGSSLARLTQLYLAIFY